MEVLTGDMIIRVPVPSALPLIIRLVLLRIMDAEVVGLEPANLEIRTGDTARKVAEIVVSDDCIRRVRRAGVDVVEAIAASAGY